jgi:hypothetical protein
MALGLRLMCCYVNKLAVMCHNHNIMNTALDCYLKFAEWMKNLFVNAQSGIDTGTVSTTLNIATTFDVNTSQG